MNIEEITPYCLIKTKFKVMLNAATNIDILNINKVFPFTSIPFCKYIDIIPNKIVKSTITINNGLNKYFSPTISLTKSSPLK